VKQRFVVASLAGALALAGCAEFGGTVDGRRKLSPTEERLQAAETKIAELSKRVESLNQVLMEGGGSRGEEELRSMRGDIEKLRFDLDSLDKRTKDLYADLDRRLPGAGSASAAGTSAPGAAATAAPPASENPAAPEEEAAYLRAFDLLKGGRYDEAIGGFKSMIQKWPSGRYADNAWYWMGEAYYVKRDYASAIQSFQAVPDRFPTSPKAPSESRQKDQARATLQRVVRDYPNSSAANTARQRLAQP
jgi:tol-pal system protein YbgF